MNTNLVPTYQKLFGGFWVLWYSISNSYSIVTHDFKLLLDLYLESHSEADFLNKLTKDFKVSEGAQLSKTLFNYLESCNLPFQTAPKHRIVLDTSVRQISKQYQLNGKTIQVHYDSELVCKTIDPALAHCSIEVKLKPDAVFDVYLQNDDLFLFKDAQLVTSVPKRDYHRIQGKFIMEMLCTLHEKEEQDWIATLHGSALTDSHSSILFIGKSGKGKSTLCALLANNGFDLLADDVSPMLSENRHIYYNPSAISIKEGAFKVLQSEIKDFETLPIINFNVTKGNLKYLPCQKPKQNHYPCIAVVLVNYMQDSETTLELATVQAVLETLIPDSWLSPHPKHAAQFLDWLEQIKFYELTYSDTTSAKSEISKLFEQSHKTP